jgi:HSP20 family protein
VQDVTGASDFDSLSFQRSLRVPDTVDEGKVEAHFDNGVLKVTLPKRPEAGDEQRKIEIKKS